MAVFDRRRLRSWHVVLVAAALGAASAVEASVPLGPTFQVNSDDAGTQSHPKVEADGTSGGFVVAWHDYDAQAAEARRFDPAGGALAGDFQVNQTSYPFTYDHYNDGGVAIAVDPVGGFVVAWYGREYGDPNPYGEIPHTFLRLYEADGDPRGDEFTTTDPTNGEDDAANPEISIDANGAFVVAWEGTGYAPDPGDPGGPQFPSADVFGQVYSSAGNPIGGEFQANIFEYLDQANYGDLGVARAPSGNSFVVVWGGTGPGTGSGYYAYPTQGIHGRRFLFDAGAAKQFTVTTVTDDRYPEYPEVAMDPAGNFVVVWRERYYEQIEAQRFGVGGQRLGGLFQVSTEEGGAYYPAVDGDELGNFIVAWSDSYGIRAQVLDALGNRRGTADLVYDCGAVGCGADGPDVAALGDEEFVVAWPDIDGDDEGVFARRYAMEPLTEVLLGGKSLQIRNGAADLPPFRRAIWKTSGVNIASPARGSDDDPRCNGDPSGTVKATMRFFSDTTGQDTGALGLPCQNWSATGPSSSNPLALQGYKYKDAQLADGLCTSVVVKRTKLVKATCREIAYDLLSGVDQGTVYAVLSLGQVRYCTSFDDSNGRDGSDGILFQGKDAPAPEACPAP